ncbi:MAG: hypothetical protein MUC28_00260 [Planctomycetes bacterium]|jgi:hypothetical protein|nr:hypothetical protein [Planctomycetota bacterium]
MIRLREDLAREVKARKERQGEIRLAMDNHCRDKYGIKNFTKLADDLFGPDDGTLSLCLARQVPTANIEHVALIVFTDWLNGQESGLKIKPLPLSLISDSYAGQNSYKKSLVHVPWLRRRTRPPAIGQLFCQKENILPKGEERRNLDGRILSGIKILSGENLTDYHIGLFRKATGLNGRTPVDTSGFFASCLKQCLDNRGKSPYCGYADINGREVRIPLDPASQFFPVRPPAEWFYFLHMLLFVDGRRALVECFDDSARINSTYHEAASAIQHNIGWAPLVVAAPLTVAVEGYHSEMYEINPAVFRENWKAELSLPNGENDLTVAFSRICQEVINLS